MKKISIKEAAQIMNVSPQFIRIGLQRKLLPFGVAVQVGGRERFTYYINPEQFKKYISGN